MSRNPNNLGGCGTGCALMVIVPVVIVYVLMFAAGVAKTLIEGF